MPGMLFTNALMLAGLAALAIPVLIHLLLKRRKKHLQFSTTQFFARIDTQSSQRRKLRNWLLLSLRLLLVTLLVVAFARPYLPQSGAAADARRRQVVIVLDRSASLRAVGADGPRWGLAKEQIRKLLSNLGPEDRVALVSCSSHTDVLSGFAPPATVGKMLHDLEPMYGTSDLAQGLQQAAKLASGGDAEALSTVYLVSDLQDSACRNLGLPPLPQSLDVKFIAVGDLAAPNLALSQLDLEASNGSRPRALVANYSDETISGTLELAVDGERDLLLDIRLAPASTTNLMLSLPPLKPGWHSAQASLRVKDAFELDNTRYATWPIPEPTRVLLVQPSNSRRIFEQESFFLCAALDPTKDSTNPVPPAFNPVQMTPEEAVRRLSNPEGQASYDLVILPGLKDLPAGCGKALDGFIEAGGGLILFVGDGISANHYNNELSKLLPASLGAIETSGDSGGGWRMGEFDTNILVFAAFRRPNSGDLHLAEFTRRFALNPVDSSRQLAWFDDEAPFLVMRTVGRGRVVLVNTSADASWNDWPKHKTFVPWLHGLGKYAAGSKPGLDPGQQTNSFIAETDFDLACGDHARLGQFKLRLPSGQDLWLKADAQGRLRDPALALPGIYCLRDKDGNELRRLAVNIPPQESDLKAIRPSEAQGKLSRVAEAPRATLAGTLFGSKSNRKELYSVLLLGVLGLLLAEMLVANRTLA